MVTTQGQANDYSMNRIALDSTKCVGVLLWLASLILIFNVVLIISGTMADSSEFVGALHDNLVVEPHSLALVQHALHLYTPLLLISFIGIRLVRTQAVRKVIIESPDPLLVIYDNYRQPFVQQFGCRAPPSDK
ncbi:hypothetical protein [Alteromonas sp. C1M14]|uniref:hypothetical protein n=1 Tax=Alteromonas sp. C1M14 TaxID=2841567 RepID=UPI001C08D984|nr:hypothetical protein [Alteromonas sp. C1M14]MBU2979645.1 hypothetical protein [Alteromonas sp. C1M14]